VEGDQLERRRLDCCHDERVQPDVHQNEGELSKLTESVLSNAGQSRHTSGEDVRNGRMDKAMQYAGDESHSKKESHACPAFKGETECLTQRRHLLGFLLLSLVQAASATASSCIIVADDDGAVVACRWEERVGKVRLDRCRSRRTSRHVSPLSLVMMMMMMMMI